MAGADNPSKTRFVVRRVGRAAEELQRKAGELGRVEPLEEGSELSLVEVEEHPDGPKAAWERLQRALGPEHQVAPVLVDDEGSEHYPTGRLTVRFHEAPSDEALAAFAAEHGLELKSRNKWVALQADFETREKESYLPELVRKLEEKGEVRAAWPTTLSRYRRH